MPKRKPVQNKHVKARPARRKAKPIPVTESTFPAPPQVQGQARSRASFESLQEKRNNCPWWRELERLMQEGRFDWRKAAYIAWASSPYKTRWPATLKELCDEVLGCSDSVVHKWRRMNKEIDQRVAQEQVAPLMLHRSDVIHALIDVASTPDPSAHSDRKLYLEIIGEYKPKSSINLSTWQSELIKLLKEGTITEQDVIAELGLDDARAILIAAGKTVPASTPSKTETGSE